MWLPQPNLPETGRYFKNAAQVVLYRRILERVRAIPGVEAADGATRVPFGGFPNMNPFVVEGRDPERGGLGTAEFASASAGYFGTMGIPLERGARVRHARRRDGALRSPSSASRSRSGSSRERTPSATRIALGPRQRARRTAATAPAGRRSSASSETSRARRSTSRSGRPCYRPLEQAANLRSRS
jgi:hypothetical protein